MGEFLEFGIEDCPFEDRVLRQCWLVGMRSRWRLDEPRRSAYSESFEWENPNWTKEGF